MTEGAKVLGVDRQTLSNLVNAKSGVSAEMALRLEMVFGTAARDWLLRQLDHDLELATQRARKMKLKPYHAKAAGKTGEQ